VWHDYGAMSRNVQGCQQGRKARKPLEAVQLRDLALSYVARYATSGARLERYLARKLAERGWADEGNPPDLGALIADFVQQGYVDDAGYARMRAGSLERRGYGARRVVQALAEAGVAEPVRRAALGDAASQREAALVLARKRRLGPFGAPVADRAGREKQLGVLLRAGHAMDMAREIVNAASVAALEEWAAELDGDELHERG